MDVMEVLQKVQLSPCQPVFSRQFLNGLADCLAAGTLRSCQLTFLLGRNPSPPAEPLLPQFCQRWRPNSLRSKDQPEWITDVLGISKGELTVLGRCKQQTSSAHPTGFTQGLVNCVKTVS